MAVVTTNDIKDDEDFLRCHFKFPTGHGSQVVCSVDTKKQIANAFLRTFYAKVTTKRTKRNTFWLLYKAIVPYQLRLSEALMGREISSFVGGSEVVDMLGTKIKRRRNTIVTENKESYWPGMEGPNYYFDSYDVVGQSRELSRLLMLPTSFNYSFPLNELENRQESLKLKKRKAEKSFPAVTEMETDTRYVMSFDIPRVKNVEFKVCPPAWIIKGTAGLISGKASEDPTVRLCKDTKKSKLGAKQFIGEFELTGKFPDYVNIHDKNTTWEEINGTLCVSFEKYNQSNHWVDISRTETVPVTIPTATVPPEL